MNPEELEDHHLIQRLLNKESSAWKEVYTMYSGKLTAICSRYIVGKEDVRDVLQNSFVSMFSKIHLFENRGKGALRAWMSRIVINESLQFLRKNGNSFDFTETNWENIVAENTDEEPALETMNAQEIMNQIQMLPDGYRTVFNLYVFEEKTHNEIAEMLGISEGTSASQFSRAKKVLATQIKKYQLSKTSVL